MSDRVKTIAVEEAVHEHMKQVSGQHGLRLKKVPNAWSRAWGLLSPEQKARALGVEDRPRRRDRASA